MTPLRGARRTTIGWAVFGTVSLLTVLLTWNLVSLNQTLSRLTDQISTKVLSQGERSRHELAPRGFLAPKEPSPTPLRPDRDPEGALFPRQIAVVFGSRVLWAVPPDLTVPTIAEPIEGTARVEKLGGSQWVYAFRLPDGRVFLAIFDAPGYEKTRSRLALLASFEVAGAGLFLLVWGILAWRLYATYRVAEVTARQAGVLLFGEGGLPGTADVVTTFRQTVEKLAAQTAEFKRLHAEEKSRAESGEVLARELSAHLGAAFLFFNAQGNLEDSHADARPLLGLPDIPLKGHSEGRVLASHPEVLQLLQETRESRAMASRDEVSGAGGRLLQLIAIPLPGQVKSRGVLLILRDQTALYRMRQTLREREALSRLGEVAAGVAHEVRNGLNVLTLQLKNLKDDHASLPGDPRLSALQAEIGQLEQVVQELLFFAKPLELNLASLPALEILEAAAERIRALCPQIAVEIRCPEELEVSCDPEPLGRALHNLVRNAAEAMAPLSGEAARVLLLARDLGSEVELRVEDSGPGLPEETREASFVPFATQKAGGTGLGLSIARKVAREHGGNLEAVNPEFLPGAALRLTLPKQKP